MKIIQLAINPTSFGNCSIGILNELYKRNYNDFILSDIGNPDLSTFDKLRNDEGFINWLNDKRTNFLEKYSREYNKFSLWHINGSENSISNNNTLETFFELDSITPTEKNILNQQNRVVVTSQYTKDVFIDGGVTVPIDIIPLGFDSLHFYNKEEKRKIPEEICSWTVGPSKFENRKRHLKTIKLWIKKFSNNPKHILNIAVYNPFLKPEDNQRILGALFDGKPKPFNCNILSYLPSNAEVNDLLNMTDIIINGSGAEGWSLPDFNAAALGKHVICHHNTGMKEWANEGNATLVEASIKIPAADGMFFRPDGPFNVGNIFDYDEQEFLDKLDVVYDKWKANRINTEGLKLAEQFTWTKTVDKILEVI